MRLQLHHSTTPLVSLDDKFKVSFRPVPQSWPLWVLGASSWGCCWSSPRGSVHGGTQDPVYSLAVRFPAPTASQRTVPKGLCVAITDHAVTGELFPGACQEHTEITLVSQTTGAARHTLCEERKHLPKVSCVTGVPASAPGQC